MSRIRSKNTGIELNVRKKLHEKGYRYRIHYDKLKGKPDIVFPRKKIAIFLDGDFWHGYNYKKGKSRLQPYWAAKIERNMMKDEAINKLLLDNGWIVLRFWQHEIKRDIETVIKQIENYLI